MCDTDPDEVVDSQFDGLDGPGQVWHGIAILGFFMEDNQPWHLTHTDT